MRSLDAAMIKGLADQLSKVAGSAVDVDKLQSDLVEAMDRYTRYRDRHKKRPRDRELRDFYERLQSNLAKVREAYETLLAEDGIEYPMLYATIDLDPDDARQGVQELHDLVVMHERWLIFANSKAREMAPRSGGRPRLPFLTNFLLDLAKIYEKHTDRRAGTSSNPAYSEKRTGPFVRFAEVVVKQVEPGLEKLALGKTLSNALAQRKLRRKLLEKFGIS